MRILHTADWHAGRLWKSQNRLDELRNILEHLGDFIEREWIDLVLMSGDVFENQVPTPEAERAVSSFFMRLGRASVPSVVVAGNHDHPMRLDTWGLLAEFVGVRARGLPRQRTQGGLIEVPTRSGEIACVATVPFAPVGRIVEALTLAGDETLARQQYADAMQHILAHLAGGFRKETVNLVVAHTYIAGAKSSGSERLITLGDDWAATAQSIPPTAQYVALGHIHRPQRVEAAGPHTEYAGSPMQLDFGEVDDEKSFVVVDVSPRKPPRVERVPYEGGVRLGEWSGTMTELERDAEGLKQFGYLKVKITLDEPNPDLNRRARQILPNIVVVDAVLPESPDPDPDAVRVPISAMAPVDQFRSFYRREHQREAPDETVALFSDLYASASQDGAP
ncbi:MAG TPA: exonuclease SbcCD subunit D [Vicinamibacterales bacterium]